MFREPYRQTFETVTSLFTRLLTAGSDICLRQAVATGWLRSRRAITWPVNVLRGQVSHSKITLLKDCSLDVETNFSHRSRNKTLIHSSASRMPGRYVMFHTLDLLDLLNGDRYFNTLFLSILHVCAKILEGGGTWLVRQQQDYVNFTANASSMWQLRISGVVTKCATMVPKQSKH